MATPDMDVIKEIPGYKVILKAILKSQIQQLVEQLASHTDEESVILTASVSDGTLCHMGSDSGKVYLEGHEEIKSSFLGFCLKRFHEKKLTKEQEKEDVLLAQQMHGTRPHPIGPPVRRNDMSSPQYSMPHVSPRQRQTVKRHQPYQMRQGRKGTGVLNKTTTSQNPSSVSPIEQIIKVEPVEFEDGESNMADAQFGNDIQQSTSLLKSFTEETSGGPNSDGLNELLDSGGQLSLPSEMSSSSRLSFGNKNKDGSGVQDSGGSLVKIEGITDPEDELGIMGIQRSFDSSTSQDADWGHNTSQEQEWLGPSEGASNMQGYNQCRKKGQDLMAESQFQQTNYDSEYFDSRPFSQPHQCPHCSKHFSSKTDLTRHIMIHTGERPYKCDICGKTFRLKHHFINHKGMVHKVY